MNPLAVGGSQQRGCKPRGYRHNLIGFREVTFST